MFAEITSNTHCIMDKPNETIKQDTHDVQSSDGVIPGSKGDPFRYYRITKQLLLLFTWLCIVSILSYVDIMHLFYYI